MSVTQTTSKKICPILDEMEIHLITDPQAMVAALLSKRVYWSDVLPARQYGPRPGEIRCPAERQSHPLCQPWAGRLPPHLADRKAAVR